MARVTHRTLNGCTAPYTAAEDKAILPLARAAKRGDTQAQHELGLMHAAKCLLDATIEERDDDGIPW